MKRTIILSIFLLSAFSCNKEDYNEVKPLKAPAFAGTIETSQEVDLGLNVLWCGYNVGAAEPAQCGNYYAWGELSPKDDYSESTYAHAGGLAAGQRLSPDKDVATAVFGEGWNTPSVSDWQELSDNCSISLASYNGTVGYVATSKVAGFEGKSIFFPCAGYRAGTTTNNVVAQALYWANQVVDNADTRAVNAFFTEVTSGSELRLNRPPKGVGGLVWCGYPVRAVKRGIAPDFSFASASASIAWDTEACSFELVAGADVAWSASVKYPDGTAVAGASVSPASGTGAATVNVTLPTSSSVQGKTVYWVELTTADARIPEELRTIRAVVEQDVCPLTPFGTVWANSFLQAWAMEGFTANTPFTAETATATASSELANAGKDNGYLKGKFSFRFTVAQSGTGILSFAVLMGSATHTLTVSATRAGASVFSEVYTPGTNTQNTSINCEMTLKKGDIVTVAYNTATGNARLYCGKTTPISWTQKTTE
ncbi:MAG: hypothetical protein J6X69_04800 [Bacteroidales bacterium]|nr:hypothetical protein [Bacteroidales bacterium]